MQELNLSFIYEIELESSKGLCGLEMQKRGISEKRVILGLRVCRGPRRSLR
jgi:hypothetical protein